MDDVFGTPANQKSSPVEDNYALLTDSPEKQKEKPTQEEIQRVLQYLLSQNTSGIAENLMGRFAKDGGKKKSKTKNRRKTSKKRR